MKHHVIQHHVILCALIVFSGCRSTATRDADAYFDLGNYHFEITTGHPEAQLWFDRGLILCYGFNHEEAIRCFEKAAQADPECAMAYWGSAYASGININNTEMDDAAKKRAYENSVRASELANGTTPLEQALIQALAQRYTWPFPADLMPLERAYASAMDKVRLSHPESPDAWALSAESRMNLRPWKLWSPDGTARPGTSEIVATLERGLAHWPEHPGLCHFYIHTMEASPNPGKALPAADSLRGRVPDAGHLVHMPSHIDVLVGQYPQAIEANQKAIQADAKFVRLRGRENFYTLYRIHNYHFVVYAAMFDGQSALALEAARELVEEIPQKLLQEWTDYVDAFVPTPLHVLVRFGRWEDILAEPRPADGLPVTRSIWHYARGLAYAATERVAEAEGEREAFQKAKATVPETSILFNNTSRDILGVAEAMLDGEIEYRRGNFDTAFGHLREAVRRDDNLNYDEPWGWMQPARHALGALLLEQDRFEEAEAVYREDLRRRPRNPWALHGLAECLRKKGAEEEAALIEAQLSKASERTDVEIRASCYCRLGVMQ